MKLFRCLFASLIFASVVYAALTEHQTSFVVYPGDCNANNPPACFGGKLLSEMDRTAGITVRRFLYASPNASTIQAATVAINNVKFHSAARVRDLLFVRGIVTATGEKSITVKVYVEREGPSTIRETIVEGEFVFCAIGADGKSMPHGLAMPKGEK